MFLDAVLGLIFLLGDVNGAKSQRGRHSCNWARFPDVVLAVKSLVKHIVIQLGGPVGESSGGSILLVNEGVGDHGQVTLVDVLVDFNGRVHHGLEALSGVLTDRGAHLVACVVFLLEVHAVLLLPGEVKLASSSLLQHSLDVVVRLRCLLFLEFLESSLLARRLALSGSLSGLSSLEFLSELHAVPDDGADEARAAVGLSKSLSMRVLLAAVSDDTDEADEGGERDDDKNVLPLLGVF